MGNYISQEQLRSTAEAAKRYTSSLVTELGQTTAEAIEELAGLAGGGPWYGTCATSASASAKVVSCEGFTLTTGALISVRFTYAHTASSMTLNVNGTGAKTVYYRNSSVGSGRIKAGGTYSFVYTGSRYEVVGDLEAGRSETSVTLTASGWSGTSKQYQVYASGVTASALVFVSPAPASWADYGEAGIRCVSQSSNYLTFQAETVPSASITVNVVVFT